MFFFLYSFFIVELLGIASEALNMDFNMDFNSVMKMVSVQADFFILDINYRGGEHYVPLIFYAINKLPLFRYLHEKGANVYATTSSDHKVRFSPLSFACGFPHDVSDTIAYLCHHHPALINLANEKGETPLMSIIMCENEYEPFEKFKHAMFKTLVACGADVDMPLKRKQTLLDFARSNDHGVITYYLLHRLRKKTKDKDKKEKIGKLS